MKLSKNYCKTFQGLQELLEHNRFAAVHSILQRLPMLLRYFFHCSCLPARCFLVPWRLSVYQRHPEIWFQLPQGNLLLEYFVDKRSMADRPGVNLRGGFGFWQWNAAFFCTCFPFLIPLIAADTPHGIDMWSLVQQMICKQLSCSFHHHDIHQQHHHVGTNCVCALQITSVSFLLQLARGPGSCELALGKQRRTHIWWSGKWFLCTCSQFEQLFFFSAGLWFCMVIRFDFDSVIYETMFKKRAFQAGHCFR